MPEVPLKPRPDEPEEHSVQKVRMNIGGKRWELKVEVSLRELASGPAELIEMPNPYRDALELARKSGVRKLRNRRLRPAD